MDSLQAVVFYAILLGLKNYLYRCMGVCVRVNAHISCSKCYRYCRKSVYI